MNENSMNLERYQNAELKMKIIKEYCIGNSTRKATAELLECSVGWVSKLAVKYRENPEVETFIHHGYHSHKKSKITLDIKKTIVKEYIRTEEILNKANYPGLDFTDFTARVIELVGFSISDCTITKILNEENIISPKAKPRATKAANLHLSNYTKDSAAGR